MCRTALSTSSPLRARHLNSSLGIVYSTVRILRILSVILQRILEEKNLFLMQCCGSGMFIPDPGSWFLPIPDLGSRIQKRHQKRGVKQICCHIFYCGHKCHKIENYFIFEIRGFGIRKKPIPDPGSRGKKSTGSRIRIRKTVVMNTQV